MDFENTVLELFKLAQSKKTVLNNKPEQLAKAFMEFRQTALPILKESWQGEIKIRQL
ncbi:MAG: hypothetical protein IIB95_14295 [Candidatus Marinimicrobia bacterium]|nr:hypothetical protein [Candidatus Neomarinimicrobiota bacterium]